jgi:hypothetical protein
VPPTGNDYGSENAGGLSPTEREFDLATAEGKYRLISRATAKATGRTARVTARVATIQGRN